MLRITDFVGVGDSGVVAMSVESMSLRRRVPSRLARAGPARRVTHFPVWIPRGDVVPDGSRTL